MSPFSPPAGFPPHLALVWPLIWVQILMLRTWVRASYGKGTHYRWSVTPHGRVFITRIEWVPGEAAPEPELRAFVTKAQVRLASLFESEEPREPEPAPTVLGRVLQAMDAVVATPLPDT